MRDHYDFSNGIKNPYADKLKKQITIRLDDKVIDYFKKCQKKQECHIKISSIIICSI